MEAVRKIVSWKLGFLRQWWPILVFMWCVFWYWFIFVPVQQGDAYLRQVSHNTFTYTNVSRKPFPSESICNIRSSTTVIETNLGTEYKTNHRTPRWGTGDNSWQTWKVTGPIPVGAEVLEVYKILDYTCLGIFTKKVLTKKRVIDVD